MAYTAPQYTISQIIPGFGTPSWPSFQSLNVSVAAVATTTTVIPSSGTLTFNGAAVVITKGWLRARFSNIANTPTIQITITGTDGTITTTLAQSAVSAAQASTTAVEYIFPFMTEVQCNKFSFLATTTGASGTATADYEVDGVA